MGLLKKKGKHAQGNQMPASEQDGRAIAAGQGGVAPADMAQPAASDDSPNKTAVMTEAMDPAKAAERQSEPPRKDLAGFDVDTAGYPLGGEAADAGSYVAAGFGDAPKKRRSRRLKIAGISLAVIVCLIAAAYVAGGIAFADRFLPNTKIGNLDISMKTDQEVVAMLDKIASDYQIDVVGKNFSYRTTGPDLGMTIDSASIVVAMHNDLDQWKWPLLIVESEHDESSHLAITYDRDACAKSVSKAVRKFNKQAKAPVNATVVFDDSFKIFRVEPEQAGTQLDADAVVAVVQQAVDALEEKATVTDEHLKQPTRLSTDEKLIESAELATGMVSANITLNINGEAVDKIDSDTLSRFVSVNKKLKVDFDEEGLAEWVDNLANGYDTVGMERNYTRADGKKITVSGGSYGWEIDKESLKEQIMASIKAGGTSEIEIPCIDMANVYAGVGQRDWGNRYLDVDITEQHVRFYDDNGKIIWESDCITGSPDGKHDTVQGVWYVIMKQSPSKLVGYKEDGKTKDYETEVKYWMPFEGNSIGFHDAPWQPSFGGQMYAQGYGSHGCVNLPSDKAKQLYDLIQPNDVVVVHS